MIVGVSSAQAQQKVTPESFFDFEYAKGLWSGFTNEQLNTYFAKRCPPGGPDDVWAAQYRRDPRQALKDLKTNPKAELIKRCYDTQRTYDVWSKMYSAWRIGRAVYGGVGWNDCQGMGAMRLRQLNIFTGKCDDMPDWRHPKNVKEDKAAMAMGQHIQAGMKKRRQAGIKNRSGR